MYDLKALQKKELEILVAIHEACDKLGIEYMIHFGTLIGAVRHKGFIPWDDDIDIVMLRKDYRRLERILRKEQSQEFVLHSMRSDVEYVNCFAKYRKREGRIESASRRYDYYKWRGIGFDIFTIEKTNYFAARAASTIYGNIQHLSSYIRCGWLRKPLIRLIELVSLLIIFPLLRVVGLINPKGEYHYALGQGWAKHTFFMENTFPLTTAEFEGESLPVPKDMDAYLRNVYGNWREIPSDEQIRRCIHCKEYLREIYPSEEK